MNVKRLIEELQKLPQDAEVIMSTDSEGNGYSPLAELDIGSMDPYYADRYYIEDYYSDGHSDEQCCLEPGERDSFLKVICLWPMN